MGWVRAQESVLKPRLRMIRSDFALDPARGPWCVRFATLVEDKGVPMFPGKTFITRTEGYRYLRADAPQRVVTILWSQRTIAGEEPLAVEDEVRPLLHNVQF